MKRFSLIFGALVIVFTVVVLVIDYSNISTRGIISNSLLFLLGLYHLLRGLGVIPKHW